MFAARLLRIVSLVVSISAILSGTLFAADAARPVPLRALEPSPEIDVRQPAVVKAMLEELLAAPGPKPAEEKILYCRGIGHFDDFLPCAAEVVKEQPAKSYQRLTVHDGRITKTECFDEFAVNVEYSVLRYDRRGAPRVNGSFKADGTAYWYKYAMYGEDGRVSSIHTFNEKFELRFSENFNYRGDAVDIDRVDPAGKLQHSTIYENGDIFVVFDDVKTRVNQGTRKEWIRMPTKHGLKPYYPGFET